MTQPVTIGVLVIEGNDSLATDRTVQSLRLQTRQVSTLKVVQESLVVVALNATTCDYTLVLLAGEQLYPTALNRCCDVLEQLSEVDIVYSDHVRFQDVGSSHKVSGCAVVETVLKPAWSPELLRRSNYLGPLCLIRSDLLKDAHSPSRHGLMLQAAGNARNIRHLPMVLASQPSAFRPEADLDAVGSQLHELGCGAQAAAVSNGTIRLDPTSGSGPKVSLIVLTGGTERIVSGREVLLVENAIASVLATTSYEDYEVIVVLDHRAPESLGDLLVALSPKQIRLVRDSQPFNFSAANNLGAQSASGDVLVFLNDDTEVVSQNWLERLTMYLSIPDVGIVGPMLRFADGRVQHAGIVVRDGYVEHVYGGYWPEDLDLWARDVTAVTGACLAIRSGLFDELGGFNEEFPLNFNDVDLCLRARQRGCRVVADLETELLHLESASRSSGISTFEQELFERLWGQQTQADPFGHPSFTRHRIEPIVPPLALLGLRDLARDHEPTVTVPDTMTAR